jgi:hypothetical protein
MQLGEQTSREYFGLCDEQYTQETTKSSCKKDTHDKKLAELNN